MTTSIFSNSWIAIVFDGRNQQYGAYELRKIFDRNMLVALLVSVSFMSLAAGAALLNNNHPKKKFVPGAEGKYNDTIVFINERPVEPSVIRSKLTPPPPPKMNLEKFTPPKIVDDIAVIDTVPAQTSFDDSQPGTITVRNPDTVGGANPDPIVPIISFEDTTVHLPGGLEVPAEYPGGEEALLKFIKNHIKYPEIAQQEGLEGKVYVQFVVDKDGALTNVHVAKAPFKCLGDEALRVVKSMPKWKPGVQNGRPVKVRYTIPIHFQLE